MIRPSFIRSSVVPGFTAALLCTGIFQGSARGQRLDFVWPTPNSAFAEGKPIEDFIQSTASGEIESGLFGCHRSNGLQFHEGIDLKPIRRDRFGEPADSVFAALPGVVRYINRVPGESNYGRYIVIEHGEPGLPVLTLYAHLATIAPGLKIGDAVDRAQVIGVMGRSESVNAIPKDRAHLHFELDVVLTDNFQSWYDFRRFGSANTHGLWNGMNLVGFDPLAFLTAFRAHQVDNCTAYLAHMTPAVRVRIATATVPFFITHYPALLAKTLPPAAQVAGWEILFDEMGLPFSWTPLNAMEVAGLPANEPRAEPVDENRKLPRCKSLVFRKHGRYVIGRDLEMNLQLLFGLRRAL